MLDFSLENNFKYDLNTWENYKFSFDVLSRYKFLQEFTRYKYFVLDMEIFPECKYGVGDALIFSSIPEAIKKDPNSRYEKVYIRNYYKTKYKDYDEEILKTIFKDNPYIDGFIDYPPTYLIEGISIPQSNELNLIFPEYKMSDLLLYYIGVEKISDDISDPRLYFDVPIKEEYINSTIIDANINSSQHMYITGKLLDKIKNYFSKTEFPDYELNFSSSEVHSVNNYFKLNLNPVIVNDLMDYISLIKSCKHFYCLFSGSSVIASALQKQDFTIFMVEEQFNSKIRRCIYNKFRIPNYGREILLSS